jgi:hypothetical protein
LVHSPSFTLFPGTLLTFPGAAHQMFRQKKGTDNRYDKNRNIASYLVIKKSSKSFPTGPTYPDKDHEVKMLVISTSFS